MLPLNEFDLALAHYTSLAQSEGWKPYVWDKVQKMAAQNPDIYGELPKRLVAEMNASKASA